MDITKVFLNVERTGTGNQEIELPLVKSSLGEYGIEIAKLHKETGLFTFDPAYMSTASCKSTITYIDGEKGILKHRGYKIEDLAHKLSFIDVIYLLLHTKIPSSGEKKSFESLLLNKMAKVKVDDLFNTLKTFPKDSHPMAMLIGIMSKSSALHYVPANETSKEESALNDLCLEAIATMLVSVSGIYAYINGLAYQKVETNLSVVENFLKLMFGKNASSEVVNAIDKLLLLHLDHEQNASTSAVRSVGSTGVNLFGALCAGVAALWGPLHGGANEEVLNMLNQIVEEGINPTDYIAKVKKGEVKLMGFGHRVYKNYDPRAGVIKSYCDSLLSSLNSENSELFKAAQELEKAALSDEYFVSRKLFPNVDFYSGIIYKAMNIPESMFTPMFAAARVVGWVVQWKEMILNKEKITRPRQIYVGESDRKIGGL